MVKMEMQKPHLTERKCPILHEECNTGHEISTIPHGICKEMGGDKGITKVQPAALLHLLLAQAVRRNPALAGMPAPHAPLTPQCPYASGTEAAAGYEAAQSAARNDRAVAPNAKERV